MSKEQLKRIDDLKGKIDFLCKRKWEFMAEIKNIDNMITKLFELEILILSGKNETPS